jgi:hypothetical protein
LPAEEATLTMWPVARGRMRRMASFVPWMTACRLISIWRMTTGVVLLLEGPDRHDPRVVDEDVDRAQPALDLVQEGGEARAIGDVERERQRP